LRLQLLLVLLLLFLLVILLVGCELTLCCLLSECWFDNV